MSWNAPSAEWLLRRTRTWTDASGEAADANGNQFAAAAHRFSLFNNHSQPMQGHTHLTDIAARVKCGKGNVKKTIH